MSVAELTAPSDMDIPDDDVVTRSLREAFGAEFRVSAPTPAFPHHILTYRDRLVVAVETVREPLIESEAGDVWRCEGVTLDPRIRLPELQARTAETLVLDPGLVIPFLWLVQALPLTQQTNEQVVASSEVSEIVAAVEALCITKGGDDRPDQTVSSAMANGMAVEALVAGRTRGGEGFNRLVRAISYTMRDQRALGNCELVAMNVNVTIADLSDPLFLLPVLAIAAYEDWSMPTRRRTHGTGFAVDIERDPQAAFGMRLVNIRPAVPFVALAPIVSAALRCREGERFVFDELIKQAIRWAVKNDIEIDVLMDARP